MLLCCEATSLPRDIDASAMTLIVVGLNTIKEQTPVRGPEGLDQLLSFSILNFAQQIQVRPETLRTWAGTSCEFSRLTLTNSLATGVTISSLKMSEEPSEMGTARLSSNELVLFVTA